MASPRPTRAPFVPSDAMIDEAAAYAARQLLRREARRHGWPDEGETGRFLPEMPKSAEVSR
jgi:hypothetical protein